MNPEDYGMDQNSDDSTDDESAPRKPIPSWAEGIKLLTFVHFLFVYMLFELCDLFFFAHVFLVFCAGMPLQQTIMKQYYNPVDLYSYFGVPEPPKLEDIFQRTKPRFFKRTSSAVWHSPPRSHMGNN